MLTNSNNYGILISSAGEWLFYCQNRRLAGRELNRFFVDTQESSFLLEVAMPRGVYVRTKKQLENMKKASPFQKGHPQSNTGRTHFKKGVPNNVMEDNPAWKGGCKINTEGYVFVKNWKHPFCDKHGYIREHRFVVEKVLGRYLKPKERVHHINKIRTDNRIENLVLLKNNRAHIKFTIIQEGMDFGEIVFDGRKTT